MIQKNATTLLGGKETDNGKPFRLLTLVLSLSFSDYAVAAWLARAVDVVWVCAKKSKDEKQNLNTHHSTVTFSTLSIYCSLPPSDRPQSRDSAARQVRLGAKM